MNKKTTIGIIGVGHLMQHVVPGMLRGPKPPRLLLSNRNALRSRLLADRFNLEVVTENADLVGQSDIVIIAVRPFDLRQTISGLPWRANQIVVSFAATVAMADIVPLVNGATVVLGLPVVAAEYGESPTVLYPANAQVEKLLAPCGPVIPLASEQQFEVASSLGAYFGWVQMLIGQVAGWLEEQGIPAGQARLIAAAMTRAGGATAQLRTQTDLADLVDELCLPGSLTGDGVQLLKSSDAGDPWKQALAHTLRRIREE